MRKFLILVAGGVLLVGASVRAQDDQTASFQEAQTLMKEALQAKVAAERSALEARQKFERALSALKGLKTLSPTWNTDQVAKAMEDCGKYLASLAGDSMRSSGGGSTSSSRGESASGLFFGNKKTKKYHKSDCRYTANLTESSRATFMSCEDAVDAGYTACKTCKPEGGPSRSAKRPKASSSSSSEEERPAGGLSSGPFFGIASSKKVHRSDCKWSKKVADKNKIYFQTCPAAVEAGYTPCKLCKPDEATGAAAVEVSAPTAPEGATGPTTAAAPAPAAPEAAPAPKASAGGQFCASTNGKTFHRADCAWAKGIDPSALVTYKTKDEATAAGKKPCRICKP